MSPNFWAMREALELQYEAGVLAREARRSLHQFLVMRELYGADNFDTVWQKQSSVACATEAARMYAKARELMEVNG